MREPDSWISPEAEIEEGCQIGAGVRIYAPVRIGARTTIGDLCVLGHPTHGARNSERLVIGQDAIVRSHSVLYQGSVFGEELETGHHVVIREGTTAGKNLRIGNFSDVEGECEIGDYCRFHGYVHVGSGSKIGHFVRIYSLTTLMNDPLPPSHVFRPVVVEDGVVLGVGSHVLPGTTLRKGAFVAAGSRVTGDVSIGSVIDGLDGKVLTHVAYLFDLGDGIRHPWMNHFADAYPSDAQERIERLGSEIRQSRLDATRKGTS